MMLAFSANGSNSAAINGNGNKIGNGGNVSPFARVHHLTDPRNKKKSSRNNTRSVFVLLVKRTHTHTCERRIIFNYRKPKLYVGVN